ncbi:acetylxylan esterase [bacterium]|nr:acetylxylan esterase [bacterium]
MGRCMILAGAASLSLMAGAAATSGAFAYRGVALYPQDHTRLAEIIDLCRQYQFNAVQLIQEGSERAMMTAPEEAARWCAVIAELRGAGLAVHLWVHEINDAPEALLRDGYLDLDSPAVETHLEKKYHQLFTWQPELSGIVLTQYETAFPVFQNRVESVRDQPARIAWLIRLLARICREHDRQLIVRTFAYRAEEYEWFIEGINRVGEEPFTVMCKVVPWDFFPDFPHNPVPARIGRREFIQEHDLAGEYLGQSRIPACMPDRIKAWMEHGAQYHMVGAVGRISRYRNSIVGTPSEVNLAAFSRFLSDRGATPQEVWRDWSRARYGAGAAGIEKALGPTGDIVAEALFARGFYFLNNHSRVPSLGYIDRIAYYSPAQFDPSRKRDELALRYPDEKVQRQVLAEKDGALARAEGCRAALEGFAGRLGESDYRQLAAQLNNLVWTCRAWRAIADAYFSLRRFVLEHDGAAKARMEGALAGLRAAADAVEGALGPEAFPAGAAEMRQLAEQMSDLGRRADQQNQPWLMQQRRLAADMKGKYPASRTLGEWQRNRQEIAAAVLRGLYPGGRMPERTPLHARVTGTLSGEGYHVEKVMFESRPGFWVVGNLYLPDGEGPFPAMVNPIGHWGAGKAVMQVQSRCMGLARRGVAALALETVGAMERAAPGNDHDVGLASVLVGQTDVGVQVWDAMRAVDYLQSRPEIDANRIGSTGVSGGGLITLYLAALDERIVCAVPVCYVVTYDSLWSTGIWHCVCSHLPGLLTRADMGQVAGLIAPRPLLFMHGTQDDMFLTWGAQLAYREAREVYGRYGAEERIGIFESDCPHDYNQEMRERMYGFVGKWLQGAGGEAPQAEAAYALRSEEALHCGIARESLTLRDLAKQEAEGFALPAPADLGEWRRQRARILARLEELLAAQPLEPAKVKVEMTGPEARPGRSERLTVRVAEEGRLPFTFWKLRAGGCGG